MELTYEYSHLSPKQFAEQIIDRLNTTFGVDLKSIFENDTLSNEQKVRKARVLLLEGILNEFDYSVSDVDLTSASDFDEDAFLTLLSEGADIEPNFSLLEKDAQYLMSLTGDDIKTYLFNLTKRFENMATARTPGQLAIELVAGGLLSVGVPAAINTIKALKAGSTVLNAVRAGIMGIGMKTAIAAVVIALATLLLFLFLDNPKKILGMVINDTDSNLIVKDWKKGVNGNKNGDLFMAHGHMADFMEDNENGLGSPAIQIRSKINFGAGDKENVVFAGIYFANRNFGLRGAEGVMIFSSKTSALRFAHMFAVPYVNDNGTNMKLITQDVKDIETLYRELYNSKGVCVEVSEGGYRLRSCVNHARGGVVACIASISK